MIYGLAALFLRRINKRNLNLMNASYGIEHEVVIQFGTNLLNHPGCIHSAQCGTFKTKSFSDEMV